VEKWINSSNFLSIAADLGNSFKHAGLDKPPRSGNAIDQINMAYTINIPPGCTAKVEFGENPVDGDTITFTHFPEKGVLSTGRVVLTINGKTYEALDIAEKCIKDWDAFLISQKIQLLPP